MHVLLGRESTLVWGQSRRNFSSVIEGSDTHIRVSPLRRLARLAIFLLVCTTFIWIVYDLYFRTALPPVGVTVSTAARSASVVALTPDSVRLCALVSGKSFPFVWLSCDFRPRRVHFLTIPYLTADASYRLRLGFGLYWWTQHFVPVAGTISGESLFTEENPTILTKSKNYNIYQTDSFKLIGTVVDQGGNTAAGAVIIATSVGADPILAQANNTGRFTLSVPKAWGEAEIIEMTVWANEGFTKLPQPLDIVDGVEQTIRLEAYGR